MQGGTYTGQPNVNRGASASWKQKSKLEDSAESYRGMCNVYASHICQDETMYFPITLMSWLLSVTTKHHISGTFIIPPQVKRMSSTIQFRDATPADYDDVMNINDNIYNGQDYLPSYYHDFCKDPQCHMFVTGDEGKVVSRVLTYGAPFAGIDQGSVGVWAQPMRDDVTVKRRLSLAELIHRMIPVNWLNLHLD